MNYGEPYTDAERRAIEILKNAKLETDEDYENLVRLLDENGAIDLEVSNDDNETST